MSAETALKTFNKAIDDVLAFPPGPKRWRAANDLWLTLSPRNRQQYKAVAKDNRETRELLGLNKYALGTEKNLRGFLNIPTGAYYMIQRADPNVFLEKKNNTKFFKEFPEYRTAEVY